MDRRNFFKWLGVGAAAPIAAKAARAAGEIERGVDEIATPGAVKHRLIEVDDEWGCSMSATSYPTTLMGTFTATSDPTLYAPDALLDALKQSLNR